MIRRFLVLLIVVLVGSCASSRTSRVSTVGAVDGNVVEDPTGTPIRYARVCIIGKKTLPVRFAARSLSAWR